MPRLTIDNREVAVTPGTTILGAARKLGIDIPSLCYFEGCKPATSCMLCVVKVNGGGRLVPSCATLAEEGMRVENDTPEIRQVRKTGLELLLSDHAGDCEAPCQHICPTHMNIPLMLHQVAEGRLHDAIVTIKEDMAFPAVLGRVCPDLCERGCRRGAVDSPASICLVKRYVADVDLASGKPYVPPRKPGSGKKVAIVGAGPTGLSAAFHLLKDGHACTVFDEHEKPGGSLRYGPEETEAPDDVLDGEIGIIEKLGAVFELSKKVGAAVGVDELSKMYDAVLVAVGVLAEGQADRLGLRASGGRLDVDGRTSETGLSGVFAAGDAVHPAKVTVRSVAAGKEAAVCIDQFLAGGSVTGSGRGFSFRSPKPGADELEKLMDGVSADGRAMPAGGKEAGLTDEQARAEAHRCLHCDCGKVDGCTLRRYAQMYGADANRYRGRRRAMGPRLQHGDVIYEPGKCIFCGLCVQITSSSAEPLGLAFVGRGFDVQVAVPFDEPLAKALQKVAHRCIEACPTGAISRRTARFCDESACSFCQAGACPTSGAG